jgi:hypothetical protein
MSSTIWVDPLVILTMAAAVGGGLTVVWRKIIRPVLLMAHDWNGQPARAGVAARPGVMERLDNHDTILRQIHAEVNFNHGGSIKDTVTRIETDVKIIQTRLDAKDA